MIEAEPDQAPAVQLMAPGDPLDVTNLRRVELAYVIEDDFGITSAELVWEAGKDRGRKPIALDERSRGIDERSRGDERSRVDKSIVASGLGTAPVDGSPTPR